MDTATEKVNPRHLREKYQAWIGKRVTAGLTSYHYLCGVWDRIDGADVVFVIGGRELRVKLSEIATLSEAPAWQSDFFK